MTIEKQNTTTLASICLVLLRELRAEHGVHQSEIADWIGKTTSAWTKIEAGQCVLPMGIFIRVCAGFPVMPSALLATAERYATLLSSYGWTLQTSGLRVRDDGLLLLAQEYWLSPGGRSAMQCRWKFTSVLNGPTHNADNSVDLAAVFKFVVDTAFRDLQLSAPRAAGGSA